MQVRAHCPAGCTEIGEYVVTESFAVSSNTNAVECHLSPFDWSACLPQERYFNCVQTVYINATLKALNCLLFYPLLPPLFF